jgi:hypothetical protein
MKELKDGRLRTRRNEEKKEGREKGSKRNI